jgi:hypothetical protein
MNQTKSLMIRFLVLGVCLFFISSCGTPTVPCGTFTFTGSPISNGLSVSVTFDFNPSACGGACTCDTVVYIQLARAYDLNTGNFLAPTTEYSNRMVLGRTPECLNGWMLDRLDGRVWGYYGRNNDGSFAGTLTPGNNTNAAVLLDTPSGWPDECMLDFVTVPVCIDNAAGCFNNLLGYYYWWFFIASGGSVSFIDKIAVEWHRDAVVESILEWNNDAPGLGKNVFPTMNPL